MALQQRFLDLRYGTGIYFQGMVLEKIMISMLAIAILLSIPVFVKAAEATGQAEGINSQQQTNDATPYKSGDAVRIVVSSDTTHFLNGVYQIDDNGCVFLPVIGKAKIDTFSEKGFSSFLNTAYLQYLRYPTIQVRPLIRISLLGGFARPGLFYVNPATSLWETIAMAGGPVREDGIKKINWERHGNIIDKKLLMPIESGTSLKTVGIQSGDQLWITHVPKRERREIFITDVLHILSVSISALSATATVFIVYQTYRGIK
jgi:protein involved in polysaccharide export with SLBB domain